MMKYCKILTDLRIDNDLTQKEIAKELNTTQQYYSEYERGIRDMPIRHIMTLCHFYKKSPNFILGWPET